MKLPYYFYLYDNLLLGSDPIFVEEKTPNIYFASKYYKKWWYVENRQQLKELIKEVEQLDNISNLEKMLDKFDGIFSQDINTSGCII